MDMSQATATYSNTYDLKSTVFTYTVPNKPNIIVVSLNYRPMDTVMTIHISDDLGIRVVVGFLIEKNTLKSNLSDPIYQNMLKKYNILLTEKDIKNLVKVK